MTESKQAEDIQAPETLTDNAKQSGSTFSSHDDVQFIDYDEIDDEIARESMLRRNSGQLQAHILAQLAQQESGSTEQSQTNENVIQEQMRRALQQNQHILLSQMSQDNQHQAEAEKLYLTHQLAEQTGMPLDQMDQYQQMERQIHLRQIEEESLHQMKQFRALEGAYEEQRPHISKSFGIDAAQNATAFQPGLTDPLDQNTTWMNQEMALMQHQQLAANDPIIQQQLTAQYLRQDALTPGEIIALQASGQMPQNMDPNAALINQVNTQATMESLNMQGEAKIQMNFQGSWIEWFCSLEGNEFMLVLPRSFLYDKFNWLNLRTILKTRKQRYEEAQMLVFSKSAPSVTDLSNDSFQQLNQEASDMYGLMHARYLESPQGLAIMYGKYLQGVYGQCPRALCNNQSMVPCGMSNKLRTSRVKTYCCKCEELYISYTHSQQQSNRLDGSYFGSSLAHKFFTTYEKEIALPTKVYYYEPKIFGFKIAGKVGSKYQTPKQEVIVDTEGEQELATRMLEHQVGQEALIRVECKVKNGKPLATEKRYTAAGNANKNNNNTQMKV